MLLKQIAGLIDHTLLRSDASEKDMRRLCAEAEKYGFFSVCTAPCFVTLCRRLLNGSQVKVCATAGFPLGSSATETKRAEAARAVRDGADEIDMVMNVGALKSGKKAYVLNDIKAVRKAVRGKTLKVIIEACYLTRAEKIAACRIAEKAGADFVKTSTGFGTSGAKSGDVRLMRRTAGPRVGVKAAGGIRTYAELVKMVRAGANRIGTSNSVKIMKELSDKN